MAKELLTLAQQLNLISLRALDAAALLHGQDYIKVDDRPGESTKGDKQEKALRILFEDCRR